MHRTTREEHTKQGQAINDMLLEDDRKYLDDLKLEKAKRYSVYAIKRGDKHGI